MGVFYVALIKKYLSLIFFYSKTNQNLQVRETKTTVVHDNQHVGYHVQLVTELFIFE